MTECPATLHHPTRWCYLRHGCRCPETVAAQRERERERARRRQVRSAGARLRSCPDVDDIAVERVCAGERLTLTRQECAEAIRRLTARGESARTIATRLGIAQRTVFRHRTRAA